MALGHGSWSNRGNGTEKQFCQDATKGWRPVETETPAGTLLKKKPCIEHVKQTLPRDGASLPHETLPHKKRIGQPCLTKHFQGMVSHD